MYCFFKSSSARSVKLESQLHLGYCMGIHASDAESNIHFLQNLLLSGLRSQKEQVVDQ